MRQYYQSIGRDPDEYDETEPVLPVECQMALGAFIDLSAGRSWSQAGPNPIGYGEIEAYCRLMRAELWPIEVEMIRKADQRWIECYGRSSGTGTQDQKL